jgi:hypothetical protein
VRIAPGLVSARRPARTQNQRLGSMASTLAVLPLLGNAETLLRLRDRLMYLQRGYRIEKIEPEREILGLP